MPRYAADLLAVRCAIEAQYARLDGARAQPDAALWAGIVAPEARFTLASGDEIDLDQWLTERNDAALDKPTTRTVVQSMAAEGDTAHADVSVVLEGLLEYAGMSFVQRVESANRDTWIKRGGDWLLGRSEEVRSKVWLDGVLRQDIKATPPLPPALREAIVSEVRTRAIPFETMTAGSGFDDLAALDGIIGDARIVALGEATHGTAEFFRMKHRLFEYLVERKGFTVLAFETTWPDTESVNRYIHGGEGSAETAMQGIFPVWETQEVLDLVEWIRAYNSKPGRTKRLSFEGFDVQGPGAAIKCVTESVSRLGKADAASILRHYEGVEGKYWRLASFAGSAPLSNDERAQYQANVTDALKLVEDRKEALLRILTAAEFRRVHQCAKIVVQSAMAGARSVVEMNNYRDAAMADNVRWLAQEAYPSEKIALWAHNGHVATAALVDGMATMGRHLRAIFGQQMRVLGFCFDRGEVRAVRLKDGKVVPGGRVPLAVSAAKASSAEALLRATDLPCFILDLRAAPASSPLGDWLGAPHFLRSIGWAFDPDKPCYEAFALAQAFDALIFIAETTAAVSR
jgi:erythromycin esterase